jgi:hypothetical protein
VELSYSRAIARLRAIERTPERAGGASEAAEPPRLVKELPRYNLVKFAGRYYGAPWSAGPIEIDKIRIADIAGVFVETTYEQAMERLGRMDASR